MTTVKAKPDFTALDRRARRRLMLRAALRATSSVAVLVVLYYMLPMDHAFDAGTDVLLLLGLSAFVGMTVLQVRSILRSAYPAVQAVQVLATAIPLFLLLFATTYFLMSRAQADSFTEPLTRTDALYFTITVFATVGFGDITAKTQTGRVVTMVQMIADLLVLGLLIRVVLSAVQAGQRRLTSGERAGDAPAEATTPADGPRSG